MNIALWIVAGLMAAGFLFAGANKLLTSYEKLAQTPGAGWANDFSPAFVKLLGAFEVLGAVGLILPGVLNIVPVLVPIAAVGLGVIQVGAAITELRRGEAAHAVINLVYIAAAVFVAWGRFSGVPFG
ncbi:DoxX family protein [Subtercola lobariae]|uniref:DoxX family protein n=1 Tax=Subtercola lobariae TaxID=1588641 RepID=A0A917EZ66_9MICO|nr:DoxX family protein [Subtercola lobariae]GGF36129.1 hypothetical protein GCM10011399_31320 [Subtercola lobariae]